MKDGRRGTLPSVLYISSLTQKLIVINKMGDVGVHTTFEKDSCNMVWGETIQMRGVYNLLGRTYTNGCIHIFILEVDKISSCLVDSTTIWHQQMGHISENGLCAM